MERSIGHKAFIAGHEYYTAEDGALYSARQDLPVMPDGRRSGRWECTKVWAEPRLAFLLADEAAGRLTPA